MITPEQIKFVQGHEPQLANAIIATSDVISLKNAHGVLILVHHYSGGGDTDVALTVNESSDVAGTGDAAISTVFPIWHNIDVASTLLPDNMARLTDAATVTIDTGAGKDQIVAMWIDAAILSAGFDCVKLVAGTGNVANYMNVMYLIEPRYAQEGMPSAIVD